MSDDLETLIAAAERTSRVWRQGEAKAKDTVRAAFNDLDWIVADIKKRMSKDATSVIRRSDVRLDQAGE